MEIPRKVLPSDEYMNFVRETFLVKKEIRDTPLEDDIFDVRYGLIKALCRRIEDRGLSCDDDIYVLYDYGRYKTVPVNFVGEMLEQAEQIAYDVVRIEAWNDYAVCISAGYNEVMPFGCEEELVTKDGIVMRAPEQ